MARYHRRIGRSLPSGLALLALSAAALAAPGRAFAQEPSSAPPLAPLPPAEVAPVAPVAPPSPAPPPTYVAPRPHGILVHVTARQTVMLQILSFNDTRWRDVCLSPCDVEVPLEAVYRVVAPAMMPSRELALEAGPGDRVELDVNVRSLAQHRTAERLTIAGYIAGAVGLGLEIAALAVDSSSTAEPVLLWSGAGAAVAAISLTITSWVLGQPTGVSQSRSTLVAGPPPGTASLGDGTWGRAPLWQDTSSRGPSLPTAVAAPLFTTRF